MISALLLCVAFATSFFIQTTLSTISGAWFAFFIGCIFITMFQNKNVLYKDPFSILCILWLVYITAHVFLFRPVLGGAVHYSTLCAPFVYYIAMMGANERTRLSHLVICGSCIFTLSLIVCYQWVFDVPQYFEGRVSRPLLNPNNMAALMNVGLVTCFGLMFRNKFWAIPLLVFTAALCATGSKAGILSAIIACGILSVVFYPRLLWSLMLTPLLFFLPVFEGIKSALLDRVDIWQGAFRIFDVTYLGTGLGTFPYYYSRFKIEDETMGMFAHNDILQFAVELGLPAAIIFVCVCLSFFIQTKKSNIIPACAFLAVLIHTQVSFHLYLPSVSILAGLCFVQWGRFNKRGYL